MISWGRFTQTEKAWLHYLSLKKTCKTSLLEAFQKRLAFTTRLGYYANGHIFYDSPSIWRRSSTRKVCRNHIDFERRFRVEISTWIRLSKLTKYRWVFYADFSMSFRCWIDVTSVLAVSILLFPNIFCSENLF